MYNIMTCQGSGWTTSLLGDCSLAWISFIIVVFLAMIVRRQCEDGFLAGIGFNLIGAFVLGIGLNILMITLTGSARWALVLGIAGIAAGGYFGGLIFDQGGESG